MDLLILPSLLLARFSNPTLGLFKKFDLWSFKAIKQLLLPFANTRLTTSLFSIIIFPSALTLLLILLGISLCVEVIASVVNLLVVYYRATWCSFKPNLEKIRKNLPRKNFLYFQLWNFLASYFLMFQRELAEIKK